MHYAIFYSFPKTIIKMAIKHCLTPPNWPPSMNIRAQRHLRSHDQFPTPSLLHITLKARPSLTYRTASLLRYFKTRRKKVRLERKCTTKRLHPLWLHIGCTFSFMPSILSVSSPVRVAISSMLDRWVLQSIWAQPVSQSGWGWFSLSTALSLQVVEFKLIVIQIMLPWCCCFISDGN